MIVFCKKVYALVSLCFCVVALCLVVSCSDHAGLGESIDTEAPKLEISYPPASAVIKGSFIFAGTSSDDKGVKRVAITVKNASAETVYTGNAAIDADGNWQISLNEYDAEKESYYNGWQFADGTYEISAVASDNSGRSSGTTSRAFSIDNTAPVLVLTKPTSVGASTAKSYGQLVQLQGSFSEMTENIISKLALTFYNADGSIKHTSSFSNISDMSSANPLTVAQYYKPSLRAELSGDDLVKWENYTALYGAYEAYDEKETPASEQSYFTLTAYDAAKVYQNIGDTGTGDGNATSMYYRGTTEMLKLIEKKNATFSDFSVLTLRKYLNGTGASYSSDDQAALEAILSAAKSVSLSASDEVPTSDDLARTDTSTGNVFLTFEVNPNNNPKFTASGFAIDTSKANGQSYSDANSGAAGYKIYYTGADINLKVAPGLDETKIDTSTVSVYAVPYSVDESSLADQTGYASDKVLLWTWNEVVAVSYAAKKSLTDSSTEEYATALALVKANPDVYRYTLTDAGTNDDDLAKEASFSENDVTNKLISLGTPYYLYIEGADIDGQPIVNAATDGYGIWPTITAAAPELTISTTSAELLNEADFVGDDDNPGGITFTGSVNTDNAVLTALTYTATLTSASDNTKTVQITGTPEYKLVSELPYTYSLQFTVSPNDAMSELLAETKGLYSLTVSVQAKSTAAPNGESVSRSYNIDTKAPTVSNVKLSNSVTTNGTVYIPQSATGVGYTLSGVSVDNYVLASTAFTVTGVDSAGEKKTLTVAPETSSEWTTTLDLTGFAARSGAADITISVVATDSAGNESSPVTLELELDTSAPTVTLTAGSSTSEWNKSTALTISGTTSDAESGATTVYYKLNDATDATSYTALAVTNNKFSTNETFVVGTNTIYYYAEDAVGNTSAVTEAPVKIDTVAPIVSELPDDSPDYTSFETRKFGKTTDGVSFAFLAYDADSKIDSNSIEITIGDKSSLTDSICKIEVIDQPVTLTKNGSGTITGITAATTDTEGSVTGYKIVVKLNSSLGDNLKESNLYTVTATVPDYAGNTYTPQIGILTLDKTPPKVTVTKVSGSAAYVNGVKQISAIIQESGTIAAASYEIFAESDTSFEHPLTFYPVKSVDEDGSANFVNEKVTSATIEDPTASVSFYVCTNGANTSAFDSVERFVVRITATDSAENSDTGVSSTYIIDTTAPVLEPENDKISGIVYKAANVDNNWYNSTTLPLSGTWTENDSGIAAMYYLLDGTGSVSKNNKTGIAYPDNNGEYAVNVDGFTSGSHTLQYLAVDNAGNASEVYTHTVKVDVNRPILTARNAETKTISAKASDIAISFTAVDADASESGVDISTLAVQIGDNVISAADTSLGAITTSVSADGDGLKTYTVTVTPSNTALVDDSNQNKLESGSTYNVQAYVYDKAGNVSSTKTVYTFTVDTIAPTVKVSAVSGTDAYVKSQKEITVNLSDTGTLESAEWAVFKYEEGISDYSVKEPYITGILTSLSGFTKTNAATAVFDISAPDAVTDGGKFVVCVRATDAAGNESSYSGTPGAGGAVSSIYIVDTTPPELKDDTLGGRAPASSSSTPTAWLSANTLAAKATLSDDGSGVSAVYYQLVKAHYDENEPVPEPMTVDNYTSIGTMVAVSGKSATFNQNIAGFVADSAANTVYYVVVDTVGNVSGLYTRYVWIDDVAPVIDETTDLDPAVITSFDTITTVSNTTESKTFKALITDAASGVNADSLSVVIASGSSTFTIPDSNHTDYGALTKSAYTGAGVSGYTVTTTITSTLIAALTDGKQYTVTLTGKDVAGNSVSQLISYLKVDTVAPKITINGAAAYVKDTQRVTVKLTDSSEIAAIDWKVCAYSENVTDYSDVAAVSTTDGVGTGSVASSELGYTVTIDVPFGNDVYTDTSKYVLCVRATDSAGNKSSYAASGEDHVPYSAVYTVDKTGPVFGADSGTVGGKANTSLSASTWFTKSTLIIGGSLSDAAGSGVATLYYLVDADDGAITTTNYTGTAKITAGTYSATIPFADKKAHTIQYLAVDALENATQSARYTFSVDATAPTVGASTTTPPLVSASTATASSGVTLEGITLSDETSGVGSILWTVSGGSNTYTSAANETYFTETAPTGSVSTYSITLGADIFATANVATNATLTVYATVTDGAGNTSTKTAVGTIKVDNEAPELTIEAPETYYVKDTLALSVKASDTNGLASSGSYAIYRVTDGTQAETATKTGNLTFSNGKATIFVDDTGHTLFAADASYVVKVTVSDSLENSDTATSGTYTIDRTGPVLFTATVDDAPYTATTADEANWKNQRTLTVGGTWSDPLSGPKYVYYQYLLNTDTTTAVLSTTNYSSVGTKVSLGTATNGTAPFSATLQNLSDGIYTIRYVAVDAVGNVSVDVYSRVFKVDTTAPASSGTAGTYLTNKVPATALSVGSGVTFSDATSGLSSASVTAGSISLGSSTDENAIVSISDGVVTVTLSKETFTNKLSSLSGYVSVTATVYDVAGNSASAIIGTLNIDTTAPTVSVTSVTGTNAYIYQTKELSVNLSDPNNVASAAWAIYAADDTNYASALKSGGLATTDTVLTATDFVAGSTAASVSFTINISAISALTDKSEFVVAVTATDGAGNTSAAANGLSSTYTVDSTAPSFGSTASGATTAAIGGKTSYSNAWFKETSLSVVGSWTEAGSGIEKVYYQVVAANATNVTAMTNTNYADAGIASGSFSTNKKSGYENFSTSISDFAATSGNTLRLVAVDNVGRASAVQSFTINIDQTSPTITKYTSSDENDKTDYSLTGTTVTGGNSDVALKFVASDADSGVSAITATINGTTISYGTTSTNGSIGYNATTSVVTLTIKKELLDTTGFYPVSVTVTDAAGMTKTASVRTLNVDKTAPTVKITSPTSGSVNKAITVSGTATDTNGVASVTVWAATSDTAAASDTGVVASGDVTVNDDGTWSTTLDTKQLYSGTSTQTAYIYAQATDGVGNPSTASTSAGSITTVTVNQNGDRPTIKVMNVTNNGSATSPAYVLLYGTNAQISGNVSDDDSTSQAVVANFVASSVVLTSLPENGKSDWTVTKDTDAGTITYRHKITDAVEATENTPAVAATYDTTIFTPATGDWTYMPADTSDGEKGVYFLVQDNSTNGVQTVFYTAAKDSNNADDTLSQPYFQNKTETPGGGSGSSAAFTYQSNSGMPEITLVTAKTFNTANPSAAERTSAAATTLNTQTASLVAGGVNKRYVTFAVEATDNNGVSSMSLTVNGTTYTTANTATGSFTASTNATTKATWTLSSLVDLNGISSGTLSVEVTALDSSGLSKTDSYKIAVDNTGPVIDTTKVTPLSTKEVTGTVSVAGSAEDAHSATASVMWLIPDTEQYALTNAELTDSDHTSLWHNNNTLPTAASFQFDFTGNDESHPLLTKYDSEKAADDTATYYQDYDSAQGLYTLPMFFKATDTLGNVSIHRGYTILHNPDADKPKTTINYPSESDYDANQNYVTLANEVRVTGGVEIPSGTTTTDAVYIQIADASSGTLDWTNKSLAGKDGSVLLYNNSTLLPSGVTALSGAVDSNWWGIKATLSGYSWYYLLNSNGGLNPAADSSEPTELAIRACGINAKGKVGAWSPVYYIHIDDNAPAATAVLHKYSSVTTASAANFAAATASAVKDYSVDMYIKNDSADVGETWYLVATLTDDTGVSLDYIKQTSGENTVTTLTENTGYYVKEESAVLKYVYIPLTTSTGSVKYALTFHDTNGSSTGHTLTSTFSLNIDNTAPSVGTLIVGDPSNSKTAFAASERTEIKDTNNVFTMGAVSKDASGSINSGIERVVMYYMRSSSDILANSSTVLLDPLVTTGMTEASVVATINADAKVPLSGLTAVPFTQDGVTYNLYGLTLSGTTAAATETDKTKPYKFTVTEKDSSDKVITLSNNHHIHKGGLIYIGGMLRKITDITGNDVTFDTSLGASAGKITSAVFIYAQSVDHSGESCDEYSENPLAPTADDGDGMAEKFTSAGNSVTWTASLHSNNMPDGPATLVVLAFDAAGNVAQTTKSVKLVNNAPRLAKLHLATDLNSDGTFENSDSITEFATLNMYETTGTYQSAISIATGSDDYLGSPFKIMDKLAVIAEIVGGNGDLKLLFAPTTAVTGKAQPTAVTSKTTNVVEKTALTTTVTKNGTEATLSADDSKGTSGMKITDQSFTLTANSNALWTYIMANTDLGKLSEYTTASEYNTDKKGSNCVSFTFWDTTEETTPGTNSQNCVVQLTDLICDTVDNENPTISIDPFKWESASSNSLYGNSTANGHIELAGQLPELFTNTGTGEYDRDPKVSGKIVITGTASDNKMLKEIKLSITGFSFNEGTAGDDFTFATYTAAGGWSKTKGKASNTAGGVMDSVPADEEAGIQAVTGDGWEFTVETTSFNQSGHTASWSLALDTSMVKDVAATDVNISAIAKDTKPNTSASYSYQVDIVPYIRKIQTTRRSNAGLKDANIRSASGKYSIMSSSSGSGTNNAAFITVTGFNLYPTGDKGAVRIVNAATAAKGSDCKIDSGSAVTVTADTSYTIFAASNAIAESGYLEVFTNGVRSLNNVNNNDGYGTAKNASGATLTKNNATVTDYANAYNREADYTTTKNVTLTDDRYLRMFSMKSSGIKNGYYPDMIVNTKNRVDGSGNIVFSYLNPSGADSSVVTSYYTQHQPTRSVVNGSTGAKVSTEYLIGALAWDQMAMAQDDSGRYLHASVYNYDGAAMSVIYDKFSSLTMKAYYEGNLRIQPTNMTYGGWGSGTPYTGQYVNHSHFTENNALTIDSVNYSSFLLDRYKNIKLVTKGSSINSSDPARVYMAYYDDNMGSIYFRNFKIAPDATLGKQMYKSSSYNGTTTASDGETYTQYTNLTENTSNSATYNTGKSTVSDSASEHMDLGVTSGNVVVVVYYDVEEGRLRLKYKTDCDGSSPNTVLTFTENTKVTFPDYVGQYVSMAIDSNNGIHIAAFDANDSDLRYFYLSAYNATTYTVRTVDAAGSVGHWTQIKIHDNTPYIAYYNATETGGRETIKLAYANAAIGSVAAGVNITTGYTAGGWEYMTVPSLTPAQGGSTKFRHVNLDFTSDGTPVIGYLGTSLEFGSPLAEAAETTQP